MKSDIVKDHEHYKKLADELLEEWARQQLSPGYQVGSGGGGDHFARIAAMKLDRGSPSLKSKPRTRRNQRTGEIEENPVFPAAGKETRPTQKAIPRRLIIAFNRISKIMIRILQGSENGRHYYEVLLNYYRFKNIDVVGSKMKISSTRAKELRRSAFDQVVMLLKEEDEKYRDDD